MPGKACFLTDSFCLNTFLFFVFVYFFAEYEVAFDKFATDGVLQYNDIKKFFESVGHVPSQKEIDEAIEIVTKSKRRAVKFQFVVCFGEQGWRSGENARLPPMWPGFDSGPVSCGLSLLFVLGLFRGFFPRFSGFPPSNISSFQFDQENSHENQLMRHLSEHLFQRKVLLE